MQILGISSSPRRCGNTDLLLDELLRGAADNKAQTEKIYLPDLHIAPCNQCDLCTTGGICPVRDDMATLYPKLLQADVLVLASPIYFMAHCAQAKIFIDRCQPFWVKTQRLKESIQIPGRPSRRGVFLAAGATRGPKVFEGAKITMKWFFHSLQMEYYENLLFEGLDHRGAVQEHPTALNEAHTLGIRLAQTSF
jgi:multimeric flavodoxin WrbA